MLFRLFHRPGGRGGRRPVVALGLVGALLVGLWLVPTVIASRWCWPLILSRVTADLDGQVTSGPASLGWFSPVVVDALAVRDGQGDVLAEVGRVRTDATLWSLLWNAHDLGDVWVERPALTLVVRDGGSNWEDLLAAWWSRPSTGATPQLRLHIQDGSLDVRDQAVRYGRVEALDAVVALPGSAQGPGEARIERCRIVTGTQAGECTASASWPGQDDGSPAHWSVSVQARSVGLALARAAAKRWNLDIRVDGGLSGDLTCSGGADADTWTVDVRHAEVRPLVVVAPAWLGTDRLALEAVRLSGACSLSANGGEFHRAELTCDVGHLTLDGWVAWPTTPGSDWWRQVLSHTASVDLSMDGRVDLARLAALLPHTLKIREDVTIASGTAQVQLSSRQTGDERRWRAHLEAADVAALHHDRRLAWSVPWQLTLDAAQSATGWQVRQLDGQSGFLRLRGQGTPESGRVELSCDVRQLARDLQDLFDLGGLEAAGTVQAQLEWSRSGPALLTAQGAAALVDLQVATADGALWQEKQLDATLSVEAATGEPGATTLRQGRVTVSAAPADRLELQLLEPVAPWGSDPAWTLGCLVRGDWGTWLARLGPWLGAGEMTAAGRGQAECVLRLAPTRWEVEKAVLRGEQVRLSGPWGEIEEPVVQAELDGSWERLAQQWNVTQALVQTSSAAWRLNDAGWQAAASPARATGELSFRADLSRLQSAWRLAVMPTDWRANGVAQGQVSLVQHEGNLQARWAVDVAGAELVQRSATTAPGMRNVIPVAAQDGWTRLWSEPNLKLTGSGEYIAARDTVQVDRFDLTTTGQLGISAEGTLAQPGSQCHVDLKGRISYDLARLLEQAWPQSQVRISGRDAQPFSLRGPLFPATDDTAAERTGGVSPDLQAELGLRWQSAQIYGASLGPGALEVRLADGTLATDAVETELSGGTLRIAPRVRLQPTPPVLTLDAGPALTQVRITPGMCQMWLKYVAPLVAEATQAEGTFSLTLGEATVPLTAPAAGRVRGTVTIHEARIGPGALAVELLQLAERIKAVTQGRLPSASARTSDTWVAMPAQDTRFEFVDGRVHHDRCEFRIGEAVVRTRGSVGLDQTLGLVAELSIPDAWLARDARLAAFRGTTLQIPIGGTLDRPRLDAQALEQLSAQILRQMASQVLEEGIQHGLQQLLGPRR